MCIDWQKYKYRQVHSPYYKRMRFSKIFQVLISEKLSLAFIMDLFKFHKNSFMQIYCKYFFSPQPPASVNLLFNSTL